MSQCFDLSAQIYLLLPSTLYMKICACQALESKDVWRFDNFKTNCNLYFQHTPPTNHITSFMFLRTISG